MDFDSEYISDPNNGSDDELDDLGDEVDDLGDDDLGDDELLPPLKNQKGKPKKKRTRRLTSDCWKHLTIIGEKGHDGKEDVRCNHCGHIYHLNLHKNGISTIRRHVFEVCKKRPRNHDVGVMMIDHDLKLKSQKLDHNTFREKIVMAIIEHGLPYSFVEYKRIRDVFSYANAEIKHWSRNTASSDCYKLFEKEKKKHLKMELAAIPSRICMTTDLWQAITIEGYICLTGHYIDSDWKLKSKILSFCAFAPPHSEIAIAMKLVELLKEWGIEKKVFSLTVDNASANGNMQTILKRNLQKDLLCTGDFFHVRCSAHILNLIVQDRLAVVGDALQKIRKSVKYVKASETRIQLYDNCMETVGLHIRAGLTLDVVIRWNSTFHMLARAIKHKDALRNLHEIDASYRSFPSDLKWKRGELQCEFLNPFDEITNIFSGTTYPTSNLYFMQIWNIECWLRRHAHYEDMVIRNMVQAMQIKFDKYWKEYSDILAIGAVLDPRMKFTVLKFCFTTLDPSTCKENLDHVRKKMKKLFEAYESNSKTITTPSSSQNIPETSLENAPTGYNDFYAFVNKKIGDTGKSPLDVYLDEPPLNMQAFESMDILSYWKDNSSRFKELSCMACDVLSIPITTVTSESSFSIGSRVLNKYRSCLLPSNVEALICGRNCSAVLKVHGEY